VGIVDRIDRTVGQGLEEVVARHHRRRLARLGWSRALDPAPAAEPWPDGDPTPRPGNRIDVLIDGHECFTRMVDAMLGAKRHVHLAGWHIDPSFEVVREEGRRSVEQLLEEVAARVRVRVLTWGGSPSPVGRTGRRAMKGIAARLDRAEGVRAVPDPRARPLHCHHEKLVIVDDRIAFVGGIDLTDLMIDRFDDPSHRPRGSQNWHDVTTALQGPLAADVAEHFNVRWRELAGETLPPPDPPEPVGGTEAQFLRTIPERIYEAVPRGDFRILEAYVRLLRSATRFVYLENQYLWSPEIVRIMADKLRHPPSPEFRMLLLLPAKANTGTDDTRGQLAILADADEGRGRFLACTIYRLGPGLKDCLPIYVHAKVAVIDDRWLMIGSANINEHSLFNDTEANVLVDAERLAVDTRRRLWAEHLECGVDELATDPTALFDRLWRPRAVEQRRLVDQGRCPTERVVELPNVSRRSKLLIGPLQGLVVDG
jgi:phosphatidylserine/phosphatidylglycerophosphate/cardiolipin synthase-like enzyme